MTVGIPLSSFLIKPTVCFSVNYKASLSRKMSCLTVIADSQEPFTLDLDLENTPLANLKTILVERSKIPVEHQFVRYMGGVLQGEVETLFSFGVREGSTLFIEDGRHDLLPVVLDRLDGGDSITVTMSRRYHTIADLKRKIEEQEGIPILKQVIRRDRVGCADGTYLSRYFRDGVADMQLEVRIDVRLNVYTGENFETTVASHDLVSVLQGRVNQRMHIPHYHQHHHFNGQAMEPGNKLCEYGVTEGSTVEVRLRFYEMTIFLKTLTGQTIVLSVTSYDTVRDVKRKVELKEGIPVDRQRIIFTGIQLNNDDRFLAHRIEHESAVHLVLRYGNSFEISVISPTGRARSVEVAPQEVVRYIKNKIFEIEGIAKDIQKVYFNDQLLNNDDATMEESGIVSGSTLTVQVDGDRNTQIFLSLPDRRNANLWVDPNYTVAQLKQMITAKYSIPEDVQEIYFARTRLDDDRTLRSYVIETNHMLHIELATPPLVQLTVRIQNDVAENLSLEEPENQTVEGLKRVITSKRGYVVKCQQLFYNGKEMENGEKLRDCDIVTGSKLDLILASASLEDHSSNMHLFVKTLTGKTITLETQLSDTVLDLKQQIFEKEGVDIAHQCLVLAGKQMGDKETVGSCGVQNQSVIHLVLRVPSRDAIKLVIQHIGSHANDFDVRANLEDTVADLKTIIEERENIPATVQRLLFDGRILVDEETLGDQNISDGLTLQLIQNETASE